MLLYPNLAYPKYLSLYKNSPIIGTTVFHNGHADYY